MDSRTGFGGMVDTSSSYFRETGTACKLTCRIRGNCRYIIIIFLGKIGTAGTLSMSGMEVYQGGVYTDSVGIVIILLCVTNITSKIYLKNIA